MNARFITGSRGICGSLTGKDGMFGKQGSVCGGLLADEFRRRRGDRVWRRRSLSDAKGSLKDMVQLAVMIVSKEWGKFSGFGVGQTKAVVPDLYTQEWVRLLLLLPIPCPI